MSLVSPPSLPVTPNTLVAFCLPLKTECILKEIVLHWTYTDSLAKLFGFHGRQDILCLPWKCFAPVWKVSILSPNNLVTKTWYYNLVPCFQSIWKCLYDSYLVNFSYHMEYHVRKVTFLRVKLISTSFYLYSWINQLYKSRSFLVTVSEAKVMSWHKSWVT